MTSQTPRRPYLAAFALLIALAGNPALAEPCKFKGTVTGTSYTGTTENGAGYCIKVPDGWEPSDGLLIYNHGYELISYPPSPPDLGFDWQLAEGYAVASTHYRISRWALFDVVEDIEDLMEVFHEKVEVPDHILVWGESMGGLVTTRTIEEADIGNVVGAMTICGIMGPGVRWWDMVLDVRLIYDVICSDVPGGAIPGGAGGLPPTGDDNPLVLLRAIQTCLGAFSPEPTTAQHDRFQRFMDLTGLPPTPEACHHPAKLGDCAVVSNLGIGTYGLRDLVFGQFSGTTPMDNCTVDYDDPEVNTTIERVQPNSGERESLRQNYTPTGQIGDIKVVSIHTDKDPLVPVEFESAYSELVDPLNRTVAVVVEDTPTHCWLNPAEQLAVWEALREWVGGGVQSTATSIQTKCGELMAGNGVPDGQDTPTGPCRISPGFSIPPLDTRVRVRPESQADCGWPGSKGKPDSKGKPGSKGKPSSSTKPPKG